MGVRGTLPTFSPFSSFTVSLSCLHLLWTHCLSSSLFRRALILSLQATCNIHFLHDFWFNSEGGVNTFRQWLLRLCGFSISSSVLFIFNHTSYNHCEFVGFEVSNKSSFVLHNSPRSLLFLSFLSLETKCALSPPSMEIGHHSTGIQASNSLQKPPHSGKYGRKTTNIVQCHSWSVPCFGGQRCQLFLLRWIDVCVWSD